MVATRRGLGAQCSGDVHGTPPHRTHLPAWYTRVSRICFHNCRKSEHRCLASAQVNFGALEGRDGMQTAVFPCGIPMRTVVDEVTREAV